MIQHHPGRAALLAGFLLHTVTVLGSGRPGGVRRGNLLAWIDFPVSLAFMHLDGPPSSSGARGGGAAMGGDRLAADALPGVAARARKS